MKASKPFTCLSCGSEDNKAKSHYDSSLGVDRCIKCYEVQHKAEVAERKSKKKQQHDERNANQKAEHEARAKALADEAEFAVRPVKKTITGAEKLKQKRDIDKVNFQRELDKINKEHE